MKNQELRLSLIKSGVILILSIFFIYSFASTDSGGVSGTLGSLFSGIIFLVGLTLALLVSVVVLFGIYFGVLYLYKPETCSDTYAELRTKMGELSESIGCGCCHSSSAATSCSTGAVEPGPDTSVAKESVLENQLSEMEQQLNTLQNTINATNSNISEAAILQKAIEARLTGVEEDLARRPTSETLDTATNQTSTEIAKVQENLSSVQKYISELESSITVLKDTAKEGAEDTRSQQIDTAITEMKEELGTIQTAIATLSEVSPTTPATKEEVVSKNTEHRILSYFTQKSDAKQFTTNVAAAVKKGMTYAEIGEYLDDSLTAEASEVIAEHPSLTKDYIRNCRQGSQQ